VKLEPPVLAHRLGYRATRTYADRPIPEWDALLRVGEIDTDSFVDRPIPMLGVSIASDERMLADTVRGYAPAIRGVAPARSTVIVKQQGRTILDTIVPAGPFALTDLRPVASRGDLDVVVIANGREVQHNHIPSATLPRMVREGAHRFAMSAGRAIRGRTRPFLVSTSMRYGLTNRTTLQAGTQWTRGFANAGAGFASNTFAGAWAVDLDTALSRSSRSHYDTSALWRLGFASASASARSAWSASASWRTGRGRIDLSEWLATRSSRRARGATTNGIATGTREVRLSTMLSYAWPSRVASHASASLRRARDSSCASCAMSGMSAELGIATQFGAAAVSLGIAHSREFGHPLRQTRISIDVRAPLSSEPRSPHIASRIDMDDAQHLSQRWTLSGFANPIHATFDGAAIANTANDDHDEANTLHASDASDASPLTYAISVSCRTRDAQPLFAPGLVRLHQALDACVRIPAAASIDLAYRDRLGETFASLSGTRTVSIRREGALVVHRGGLTWGSAAGMAGRGTFALLDTAGVGGIPLIGMADVRSDSHGFALIPSLRPYRSNAIEVDVARAPRGVALTATTRDVVPLPGAIVRVQLGAKYLQRQRIRIALADGSAPPRGARIVDARGQSVAPIGRRGRVRAAFETNMHWLADAGRRPLRVVSDNRPVCALNDDAVQAASLATPADTPASTPLELVLICQ
ncbi:MAG TPA: fimbria/pilus outer membrane usher protein, partial [Pararobbsia sp.]|nr:fimbria/pilus outer membrane usher protein [Pararobbsia sp.]